MIASGEPDRLVAEGAEGRERQAMLRFEHRGQQLVLAVEMIVQRSLGDPGRGRDLVHADARVALAAEQHVGRIEDALPGLFAMSAARRLRMYTG